MASAVVAQQLEEARRQARLNDTLRRSVLDAEDAARRVHTQIGASKLRADVVKHSRRALEQLNEFETVADYSALRRFNAAALLKDTNQQVPLEKLVKPGDRGSTEALENVVETVKRLQSLSGSTEEATGSPALAKFYTTALDGLDKAITLMRDSAVDSAEWSRMPEGLFVLLEELAALPSASDAIAADQERLRRMEFQCEELEVQQQDALGDGDMKRMEELYFQRVTVQEAMVGVYDEAFRRLEEHAIESHAQPMKQVHAVHKSTSDDVSQVMHRTEALKKCVDADIKSLKAANEEVANTAAQHHRHAAVLREQNDTFLKNNLMQIEQCYSVIEDMATQITKLSAERAEALERRLDFFREEDTFKTDKRHFDSFFKQHLRLLENTLETLEVSEEVTDTIDEVLCNGCNAVEQRCRDNERQLDAVRTALHEQRLKQFRQLYLTLGDLQYKKERNMEELEKKIEHTHIQQELAMETFNPKAKEYSETKKTLIGVRDEMAAQVQVLADKATLHIEAFKPTEEALVQAGKDFVHPVQELEEKNHQRQQKLLQYHTLMSTESGGDPEDPLGDVDPVRKTEAQLEEEMKRVQLEKQALEQRQSRFRQSSSSAQEL